MEKDIEVARSKLSASRVGFLYNQIAQQFEELVQELTMLAPADPDAHAKYKGEVRGLIGKIAEKL